MSSQYTQESRPTSPVPLAQDDVPAERPPHLAPHGSSPQLGILVGLFEALRKERRLDKRKGLLSHWFNKWRNEVGPDLYPVIRLILPQKDRERPVYGLKEQALAKCFIAALGLDEKAPDAQRVIRWKQPTKENKTAGDFPTVLYEVMSLRSSVVVGSPAHSMPIDELNDLLDELSKDKTKETHARIIRQLTNKCTPEEVRWIVRVILKDLVISVKENTVFSVFHPDAIDLFNSCSDLKKICYDLADPTKRLKNDEMDVSLFRPFQPMLCKRPKGIPDSVKLMGGGKFIIEEKLDGERMQLHKRGDQYFYCSRKAKDYTYLYGSDATTGALTPYIHDYAFDPRVKNVILDGEMLVWDPLLEKYLGFGTLKTHALDKSPGPDKPRPCFKVFDVLYIDIEGSERASSALTNVALKNRKKTLRSFGLFNEVKGRFEFVLEKEGSTAQDVENQLQQVVETRGEGLVLKTPLSKYLLGGRENSWVKIKPEYMDDMGESVDVLVVGGNWGKGKRGGKISALICAVSDPENLSKTGKEYLTFVRIGTGLSYSDYEWVSKKNWQDFDKTKPPSWLQVSDSTSTEDKGDVYLDPEDSFILTVKAASITPSSMYGCAVTMRFPRCQRIRYERTYEDTMTYRELLQLRADGSSKRKMDEKKKATKKRKTNKAKVVLSDTYQGASVDGVEVESNLFEGMTFLVLPESSSKPKFPKAELEKMIFAHGGDFCQVLQGAEAPTIVYGGINKTPQVNHAIRRGLDIIRPQWVADCVAKDRILELQTKYVFYSTQEIDDGTDEEEEEEPTEAAGTAEMNVSQPEDIPPSVAESQYPEWYKIGEGVSAADVTASTIRDSRPDPESETESEPDLFEQEDEKDDESWDVILHGDPSHDTDGEVTASMSQLDVYPDDSVTISDVTMGESEAAMHYDENAIFKHLCFYLDTPENAERNNMIVTSTQRAAIETDFQTTAQKITQNGGTLTNDLGEGKLTHVIVDRRDKSRRKELLLRTARPKRRHLVLAEFIATCIEEDTLLDEDSFAP
ncbi:hypothetical protein BOTBODRAFT_33972 [Botryobasidium botryosum FD-172 SS1]|uniref:DNA ligase n=1 Tax=Botryobasidium botryosum (strain FD-172 SS1) TaxID=930990 RepID=A0A067MC12_BOTB1|nr:hypothetical protein BOTBODRAFT_33972 [Botryobasidium botryosum FD-172 SS1]